MLGVAAGPAFLRETKSIDKGYDAFGSRRVDFVCLSERLQERGFFHSDPEREGRSYRNKNGQNRDPIQPTHAKPQEGQKRSKIRGVSDKAVGTRVHHTMVTVNRNIDGEKSTKIQDRVPTNDETTAKHGESIYI
jgi:hypothetical protein